MSGGRSAVLLATLALSAGQPVSVEALADHLWREEPPERVRASLQSQVLRLRRALGPDAIRTAPSGYVLDVEPDHVDVLRFRRLVAEAAGGDDAEHARWLLDEALRLWRGEPLAGLRSSAFDQDEVPRLQDERLAALERRVDLDLAAGRHAELAGELREEVGRHPLREPLWHRLIAALWGTGRQAEAIEAYHQVRAHLRDELGIDPSADLQRLYRRLLAGEERPASPGLDASSPLPAGAGPARPRPMQRPPDAARFTGRRAELAALDRLLAAQPPGPATSPVVALVGGAGAGKTALAVHWSHQVGDRFPGGHLHVDLRGYDPSAPAEPAAALDSFLSALGTPPELVPSDQDGRSALFRTVTAGRGLLVVADNARDSDHARPLLPGPGNLLVVTSRSQLRGLVARDGAHRVTVGPLAAPDALALLTALAGPDRAAAEPRALSDLADRCDRLPLALTIAAERALRQPDTTLADLAGELRDEEARLDSLRTGEDAVSDVGAALSWSYRQLAPEVARSFRLLGLRPGGVGSGLAPTAALLGVRPRVAREHLDRLVGLHLAERQPPDGHALPGVVRAYAAARARDEEPDGEREAAGARVIDWYLHSAGVAVELQWYGTRRYHPIELPALGAGVTPLDFDGPAVAHRWLEAQRERLVAVAGDAAERGHDAHAGRLVDIVRRFLFHHSHWRDLGRLTGIGLPVARRLGDRVAEADLLRDHAIVRAVLHDLDAAADAFHQSLGISVEIGYDPGVVHALHGLSNVCHFRGDSEAALDYRQQEREVCRGLGDGLSEALAFNSSGMDNVWIGQPEVALTLCRQALAMLEGSNDVWRPRAIGHTLDTMGQAYAALGRYGEAIPAYREALRAVTGLGDRHGEAVVRLHLGQSLRRAVGAEAALANWRQALATFARLDDPMADDVRAEISKLSA